jgi:thiosulfate/3-mercaptopyruvate sulfurtransferase
MMSNAIISAEIVSQQLNDPKLVIVDARFTLGDANAEAGELAWRAGHLPNARYVHLDRDLSDKQKPAQFGRHPLPDAKQFCDVLMRCGISESSQVVIYDANDGAMAAARCWYLLRLLGHQKVAVLDGGMARWLELGLPVHDVVSSIQPSTYHAEFDVTQIVSSETIKNNSIKKQFELIDARAAERYRGEVETIDKKAGYIPGAINRPYSLNMENGRFRDAEALKQEFLQLLGNKKASEAILYCGSGVTACHNLLAMEVAGLSGARIFSPSWSGWISENDSVVS